jgi:YbgC/YbaW family acyl-CoA thioester hydrolase
VSQVDLHVYPIAVQFEDLDFGGSVHHPKYLLFCERARCAAMIDRGYSFQQCMKDGSMFVVADAQVRYFRSLKMDEKIFVVTANAGYKKSSLLVYQAIVQTPPKDLRIADVAEFFKIFKGPFQAQIRLVIVNASDGKPKGMSEKVRQTMGLRPEGDETSDPRFGRVQIDSKLHMS